MVKLERFSAVFPFINKLYGLLFILVCTGLKAGAATYDWAGTVAIAGFYYWDTPANWRVGALTPSTAPAAGDVVRIGVVSSMLFTGQPTVRSNQSCTSIVFGTANGTAPNNLTVNAGYTLTVGGDIVQNHGSATTSGTTYRTNILGDGNVNVQNVYLGLSSQAPSASLNGYLLTFFSSQLNFTVNGNIYLNSVSNNTTGFNFPRFEINNNTVYLYGQITPVHTGSLTVALPAFDPYRSRFSLGDPTSGSTSNNLCTLYLYNQQPILPSRPSKAFIDLAPASDITTIVYAGNTGTQTVYTAGTDFGAIPYNYGNIKFQGTAIKQFASGSVTIGQNWTSAGGKLDLATNLTTINFAGSDQTLTDNNSDGGNGVAFKNVVFSGSGTKTLATGKFSVATDGLLTMQTSGTTQLAAGGNLYLLSGSTGSASVATIPTNCSITGNVNVQRYIGGGSTKSGTTFIARGYRLLSSPVYSSIISGVANIDVNYLANSGMLISGPGGTATGFTWPNSNPTLYLFRENLPNNNTTFISGKNKGITKIYSNGYVNTSDGSTNIPVPVGNGYLVYYVGNTTNASTKAVAAPTSAPENMIVTSTGTLNQGTIAANLWYTPIGATTPVIGKLSYNSALGVNAGLNMVGNPYACSIDLNALFTANTGVTTSVYQLDNINPGQSYVTYSTSGSSSPRASRYVVSGQGFIVRATGINKTLSFTEAMKAAQTNPTPILMGLPKVQEETPAGFYVKLEQDSVINSYCGVYFNTIWQDKFSDEDALDLNSTSSITNISSYTTDGLRTAVNKLSDYTSGKTIKLYTNATASAVYKLKLEDIQNIDTVYTVWLRDKYIKDSLDFRRYGVYNFRINKSDTASFGANRFELIIRRRPLPPYQLVNFKAEKVSNGIKLNWKTYNEGNFTSFTLEKNDSTSNYQPLVQLQGNGSGTYSFIDPNPTVGINTYRLVQNDIDNKISYASAMLNNVLNSSVQNISVYPNPAVQSITLTLKDVKYAGGTANIYSTAGQLMQQNAVSNTVSVYDVSGFKPGTYLLRLMQPNGNMAGQAMFIKN